MKIFEKALDDFHDFLPRFDVDDHDPSVGFSGELTAAEQIKGRLDDHKDGFDYIVANPLHPRATPQPPP